MCREVAVLELAAPGPDIRFVQMWVCDLVMSRSFIMENVKWIMDHYSGKGEDIGNLSGIIS